jgi:D-glycero-alpha-D-manno-heptose-7-phosphate kinase
MSFTGGGSDIPSFYEKYGGAVISTAINKYVYVTINKKFDSGIRISYSKTEEVDSIFEIEHKIIRSTMQFMNLNGGIEITSIADIPSKGSGLGSSSSFTVGLINALNAYNGIQTSAQSLADLSCIIEIIHCAEPIGKQDQYAAAYGGFNLIEFNKDSSVLVSPIICDPNTLNTIESNILVFYTGITRSASDLLVKQTEEISESTKKQDILKKMVDLTYLLKNEICNNNLNNFGEILHENWVLKKLLTKEISTTKIDYWYKRALDAGAIGGKLLGAGAGGFLMFYASQDKHESIIKSLSELRQININFEKFGSRIIFYN